MMQTIQQQRARHALTKIKIEIAEKTNQKEFRSYAAALPAMIHTNGLGQAAAFYRSKGGTHERLYNLLSSWLVQDKQPYAGKNDLLDGIISENMHQYRLAQAEAQALMDWVKKFAKAYMQENSQ